MDIQLLTSTSLKLKIKKTSLIVDPIKTLVKTEADAILAFSSQPDTTRVNDFRVLIDGAGEYEVGGLKISALKAEEDLYFSFSMEASEAVLIKASSLSKISADKIKDYTIAIINADSELNQELVTAMEPRVIVLYGEKANEAIKALGKENPQKTSRVSVSEEKLPEETEIFLLS